MRNVVQFNNEKVQFGRDKIRAWLQENNVI